MRVHDFLPLSPRRAWRGALVLAGLAAGLAAALAARPASAEETCVEIEIGGDAAPRLACLNRLLRKQADSVPPAEITAPATAGSPAPGLGGYNESALKQQYGPNFGKSAVPWRPTPTYNTNPR